MLDSALSSLNILTSMSIYTEKEPEEGGFAYPRELPTYNVYECKDGRYLAVASLEPDFYREFLSIIERLDILDKGLDDRTLTEELASTIARRTLQQWRDRSRRCFISVEVQASRRWRKQKRDWSRK